MVTKRTITIPIYDYKVGVIISDNWEEAVEACPLLEKDSRACVIEMEGYSIIALPPQPLSTTVHECEHLKNCIWNYIGYKPTATNDEADAYLLEYLYTQITKIIDKHKKAV